MDPKPKHGRITGQARLIKLCRPIRALFERMRNEIKEHQRRRKMRQTKKGKETDSQSSTSTTNICGICFDFKPEAEMFRGCKCNHNFCTECISNWVNSEIIQNIHKKITCPSPKCSVELKPEFFKTTLPKQVIVKWESAMIESSIPVWQKTYCPYNNCSVLLVNDGKKVVKSSECPSCHRLFCAQCNVPWHAEMKCEEFQKLKSTQSENEMDKKFYELARTKTWMRCPSCSIYVEKRNGCESIRCRCACLFCYSCGRENWKVGHVCEFTGPEASWVGRD